MNTKRYTNEDLEESYRRGFRKGNSVLIKDIIEFSKEFIHPKLMSSFELKLKEVIK